VGIELPDPDVAKTITAVCSICDQEDGRAPDPEATVFTAGTALAPTAYRRAGGET